MIERLMDEGRRYGEPEYTHHSRALSDLRATLEEQLTPEQTGLLDQLEDRFLQRESAATDGAFRAGMQAAFRLLLELLVPSDLSEN